MTIESRYKVNRRVYRHMPSRKRDMNDIIRVLGYISSVNKDSAHIQTNSEIKKKIKAYVSVVMEIGANAIVLKFLETSDLFILLRMYPPDHKKQRFMIVNINDFTCKCLIEINTLVQIFSYELIHDKINYSRIDSAFRNLEISLH